MTWLQAKNFCEELDNSRLVEIDSEEENSAISAEMHKRGSPDIWLGLTDRRNVGHFVLESTGQSPSLSPSGAVATNQITMVEAKTVPS